MSILPFVIILLLILGTFSIHDFHQTQNLLSKHTLYLSSLTQLRTCRNKQEQKNCKKAKQKKPKNPPQQNQKTFTFKRDEYFGSEQAKIDLAPLIDNPRTPSLFYETILKYMEQLYSPSPLLTKHAKAILDSIIKKAQQIKKKDNQYADFTKLYPDDPQLHPIYYKMLRGTHYLNFTTKEGYPSLIDLFKMEASDGPSFGLSYAPTPLLTVLLGKEIQEKIHTFEQHLPHKKPITKQELENLYEKPSDIPRKQLELLHDNYSPKTPKPIIEKDEKTHISTRL